MPQSTFRPLRPFLLFALLLTFSSPAARALAPEADPNLWLEEIESPQSLAWVKERNSRTAATLEGTPEYKKLEGDLRQVLLAKDRLPNVSFRRGYFYNFWQDAANRHGLFRRATLEEYRKDQPAWQVLLDLDQLSAKEKENWVYKSNTELGENSPRIMIQLSRGGKDANVAREFDVEKRAFVPGGFEIPEARSFLAGLSIDELALASSADESERTVSGFPRVVKLWRRGQPLADAEVLVAGEVTDSYLYPQVFRDGDSAYIYVSRNLDRLHTRHYLREPSGKVSELPLPQTSELLNLDRGYIYLLLKEKLSLGSREIAPGTVMRIRVGAASMEDAEVLFTATSRQSVRGLQASGGRIFLELLDYVRPKVALLEQRDGGTWEPKELPLPSYGDLSLDLRNDRDPTDVSVLEYADALTPPTQYILHDADGSYRLEKLKSTPEKFNASGLETVQYFARSKDGTEVPYFVMKARNLRLDGSNPTLLWGYGGFESSQTPSYAPGIGKAWLERGGVFVIGNIRGGGEYGPSWHRAALKEKRQNAYDDFIAVSEDLIARKITSPRHLGIQGGSNGGLLMGVMMVQRPDLFGAIVCRVPLLDMVRYHKLLAGNLWVGEYGNPEVPAELAYLLKYSPYQNVRADKKYPRTLFMTSTKDDRVHPGHARKMAARLEQQGHAYLYYENVNGGHAGSADLEEKIHMESLAYTYLWQQLK